MIAKPPQAGPRLLRFAQTPPSGTTLESGGLLSPGGTSLTFVARDNLGPRSGKGFQGKIKK